MRIRPESDHLLPSTPFTVKLDLPPLLKKEPTRRFITESCKNTKGSKCHQGGSVLSSHLLITQKPLPHAFFKSCVYKYLKYLNKC